MVSLEKKVTSLLGSSHMTADGEGHQRSQRGQALRAALSNSQQGTEALKPGVPNNLDPATTPTDPAPDDLEMALTFVCHP